jgi:hypothetical protein
MSTKFFLILVLVITSNTIFSQESVNDYKYVIVPKKYDFLESEDQYQLNSLTKFLFKKEGFKTLFDTDNKSQELANNPCLGLVSKVKNNSGLFSTKLIVELINCKNEVVYTSDEGKSKQKDYKKAYQEALRNTFKSITLLDYKYNPVKVTVATVEKEETVVEEKRAAIVKEVIPIVKVETIEKKKEPVEVIEEVTSVKESKIESKQEIINEVEEKEVTLNLLYAQSNILGFQLVDSTPKVVYVLLKSSKEDVYFLRNKKGIIYKENNKWIVEYYELDKLVKKPLTIKF